MCANGVYSQPQFITPGVPQGSVLGPLFYIIYATDLVKNIKNCEIALYADDTVLFTASMNVERSVLNLQKDINSLSEWCDRNGIMANTGKTKVMLFGSPTMLGNTPQFDVMLNNVL